MRLGIAVVIVCLASPLLLTGCLGRFASNQGRRQAARPSDHYIRKYAEPEIDEYYADDPQAREEARRNLHQDRNEVADTIVRSGNTRQKTRVGVNDRGWLTNEE